MVWSHLVTVPSIRSFLTENSVIPSLSMIQLLIERAWNLGFDREGARQLDNRLHGTNTKIGTSEVASLFLSLKIGVEILEFHSEISNTKTLTGQPQYLPNHKFLSWVVDYFTSGTTAAFRPPIYLQHKGHSRTIVGVEWKTCGRGDSSGVRGEPHVLLFDPSMSSTKLKASLFFGNLDQVISYPPSHFTKAVYQLVVVVKPTPINDLEWLRSLSLVCKRN
eukprot:TRINITY_DN10710_c0_g1_i4.p1 TRINITY_DN10710_c0_g1~~TRINITY_DN10710_c0_g1_i4.p1  ORF type:complete len:220 (-),score=41.73 TRINITY_DN10710_c0_g1_i4:156-815(-)